jgi:hypothetical protein
MKYPPLFAGCLVAIIAGCSSTPIAFRTSGDAGQMDSAAAEASIRNGGVAEDASPDSAAPEGDAEAPEPAAQCLESPTPQPGARSPVTVTVTLEYAGKPVPFGEPFPLAGGGTLTVSDFRFFVSDVLLLPQGAAPVAVDMVSADSKPVPYNLHLVNAESDAGMSFRIAAPAGDYTGMSFIFGVNDACNHVDPSRARTPLTSSSELAWPPPFGYLFLRYEGYVMAEGAKEPPPSALAIGGLAGIVMAPRVSAAGPLKVATAGANGVRLHMAIDQLFRAAALPTSGEVPTLPGGPEMLAGEHIRQNVDKVQIFSISNGP